MNALDSISSNSNKRTKTIKNIIYLFYRVIKDSTQLKNKAKVKQRQKTKKLLYTYEQMAFCGHSGTPLIPASWKAEAG